MVVGPRKINVLNNLPSLDNFTFILSKVCHLLAVGSHLVVKPFFKHQVLTTGISHYISALAIWQYAIDV